MPLVVLYLAHWASPAFAHFAGVCRHMRRCCRLRRLALGFVSPDSTVFATCFSATLVAALVGGATAGGFAAALGGAVALALLVPPDWGFAQFRLEQIVSATLFIGSSIIIIAAAESYRGLLARLREEKASRELLTHELNHRVKNIAASVQGILHQTLRNDKEDRDRAILELPHFGNECHPR